MVVIFRPYNPMEKLAIVILAAGLGKRLGADVPKVTLATSRRPLIEHVLHTASQLTPEKIVVVTGHKNVLVEDVVRRGAQDPREPYPLRTVEFALQAQQRGTGDAVKSALPNLKDFTGTVLILYGDVPLVRLESLRSLLEQHAAHKATLSLISFTASGNHPYGRIIRDRQSGDILRITEARDCRADELLIAESNSGIYAIDSAFLLPAVNQLKNENAQQEYYLTDLVGQAVKEGQTVRAFNLGDESEFQGVNTRAELANINRRILDRTIDRLVQAGVEIIDPTSLYVEPEVVVAAGVTIGPRVQLLGKTSIAGGVRFDGDAVVRDCSLAAGAHVKSFVVMEGARVGERSSVGPFTHLRTGTVLDREVKVGNFVEVKKSHLRERVKASHLSYLGDSEIGAETNIGAGTITCNYDGYKKSKTAIGAGVFVGSNTSFVAPVTIGAGATIGAGSVITKDVEADSLALTRAPLMEKSGWSGRKRKRMKSDAAKDR